jgi:hypothetical protein
MAEVTEITAVEEIRAKRAARALQEVQADPEIVSKVVGDAVAAEAAQQKQIQVPTEQRQLEFTAFYRDKERGTLEDTITVNVPKIPNGETFVIAELWKHFLSIGAIVRHEATTNSYFLYPLDQFSHYQYKFSTVVGVTGTLKNVTGK